MWLGFTIIICHYPFEQEYDMPNLDFYLGKRPSSPDGKPTAYFPQTNMECVFKLLLIYLL